MIALFVYVVVVVLLAALAYYVIDAIPIPDPINRFAKIAVVVVACLVIIMLLMQSVGGPDIRLPLGD